MVSAISGAVLLPLTRAFSSDPWPAGIFALCLVGGAALGYAPLLRLTQACGPRHSLQAFVVAWILFLVVPILVDVITLPQGVIFVTAAFMGAGLAAIAPSDAALREHFGTPSEAARTFLSVTGVVLILVVADLLWNTVALGLGVLAIVMASSLRSLGHVADPVHPGGSPFAVYLPWRLADGARAPRPKTWWTRFPAHLMYTFGTVLLFALWIMVFEQDRSRVPDILTWSLVYEIPNLTGDLPRTLVNFATGIWFNHHPVQVVYVFVLLALFGIWFEIHEGSRRAIAVFYGSSIFAGITAGLLLHLLHAMFDAAWIEDAWTHAWNGGSAGAFGLAGGYAARARKPWLLLSVLLFWEVNVELWHLRSYTVTFHVFALAFGYCWVRYALPPRATPRAAVDASVA